eukprot:2358474-Rhodomonas_salina.9
MSGTEAAYGGKTGSNFRALRYKFLSPYAPATRCPVLTSRIFWYQPSAELPERRYWYTHILYCPMPSL